MTAKEYLRQIYRINNEIKRMQRQKDFIQQQLYSLSSPAGQRDVRVQTSTSGDSMLNLIAKADEIKHDLDDRMARLLELHDQICIQISGMEDERYKTLLSDRYTYMMTWEEIAVDMHMAVRHIYRLHGDALQAFAKKYQIT